MDRAAGAHSGCDPTRDREAILRMAGTFEVDFEFEETKSLVEGYELRERYESKASEVVIVLASTPTRIVLQHVLLIPQDEGPPLPLKHWRQDWAFQSSALLEFRGDGRWGHRALTDEESRCRWSQAVYQVDDGPRYQSVGRFVHSVDGVATWTSAETWRPLPRREHTTRSDYDVLIAVNRHIVTDDGWRHEQDNRKWILEDQIAIAEERGLNTYRRVPLEHEGVALEYMASTEPFWRAVRAAWAEQLNASANVIVRDKVEGTARYVKLFSEAANWERKRPRPRRRHIARLLGRYVEPIPGDLEEHGPP